MTTLVLEPMAGKPKTNKNPVKLANDVYRMVQQIALVRDVTIADYLSDLLRPLIKEHYLAALEAVQREAEELRREIPGDGKRRRPRR